MKVVLVVTADRFELPIGVFDSCAKCDHHFHKPSGFTSTMIHRMEQRFGDRIPTRTERPGTARYYLVDIGDPEGGDEDEWDV